MSEIKTACRGTSRLIEVATMTHEEYLNLHTQGAKELRAVYEALQKENEALIQKLETAAFNHFAAQERIEAQAKRIANLEELLDYYKNMVGA